ncbi:DUF2231 domain-containing protein [Bdellovibrionota bacterium FG-1]
MPNPQSQSSKGALLRLLQGKSIQHPLHPLMIHLPIGFWLSSLVCDIFFAFDMTGAFAAVSFDFVLAGLVSLLLAVPTGLADYMSIPAGSLPKRVATTHLILNLVVTALYAVNLYARYALNGGMPDIVTSGQIILSFVSLMILGISGFLGGRLVYQYGIGHRTPAQEPSTPEIRRVA